MFPPRLDRVLFALTTAAAILLIDPRREFPLSNNWLYSLVQA
ncbi:MAG: hypothetical protein VCA74_00155 [Deltaproteobacteria bacterium]